MLPHEDKSRLDARIERSMEDRVRMAAEEEENLTLHQIRAKNWAAHVKRVEAQLKTSPAEAVRRAMPLLDSPRTEETKATREAWRKHSSSAIVMAAASRALARKDINAVEHAAIATACEAFDATQMALLSARLVLESLPLHRFSQKSLLAVGHHITDGTDPLTAFKLFEEEDALFDSVTALAYSDAVALVTEHILNNLLRKAVPSAHTRRTAVWSSGVRADGKGLDESDPTRIKAVPDAEHCFSAQVVCETDASFFRQALAKCGVEDVSVIPRTLVTDITVGGVVATPAVLLGQQVSLVPRASVSNREGEGDPQNSKFVVYVKRYILPPEEGEEEEEREEGGEEEAKDEEELTEEEKVQRAAKLRDGILDSQLALLEKVAPRDADEPQDLFDKRVGGAILRSVVSHRQAFARMRRFCKDPHPLRTLATQGRTVATNEELDPETRAQLVKCVALVSKTACEVSSHRVREQYAKMREQGF